MKCPYCSSNEDKVVDSRESRTGHLIRRRRECIGCSRRFTTQERIEEVRPMVVKRDGRREPYDRDKIIGGLQKACEKRSVSVEQIESMADNLERRLLEQGDKEVPSTTIGEILIEILREVDDVAYVRFASVYRSFKDIDEFMGELQQVMKERKKPPR